MSSDKRSVIRTPEEEQSRLAELVRRADAKITARTQAAGVENPTADQLALQQSRDSSFLPQGLHDFGASVNAGMQKAVFETKDLIFGEPAESDKSQFRKTIEGQDRVLDASSTGYGATSGISQLVTGLVGVGKLLQPVKAVQKLREAGKLGMAAYETSKAAAASGIVLDPHEERLSDFLDTIPALRSPVTAFLASDPDDSVAEGRFKNIIESIGVDFAFLGVVKVIKFLKSGQKEAALQEIAKLEKARVGNANEFGMDFTGGRQQVATDAPTVTQPGVVAKGEAAQETLPLDNPVATEKVEPSEIPGDRTTAPQSSTVNALQQPAAPSRIADDDITTILKETEADEAAIKQFGTKAEAVAQGHKFGGTTKLPWQKLHATGGALELIERTTQVLAKQYDIAKGGAVLKDDRVAALADEMARVYGEEPAMILGQITESGEAATQMTARMEAGLRLGNRMFQDAEDLRVRIANGNLAEFGGDPQMAAQEWTRRLAVSLDTMASANSILSNSARTMRRGQQQFRFKPADLARFKAMDPQVALKVMESADGDIRKASMLLNETWTKRVLDEANFLFVNNVLWQWPTHLLNVTGSVMMVIGRPTEKLIGSYVVGGKTGNLLRQQALKEYLYTTASLGDAWTALFAAFNKGDSILSPHNTEVFQAGPTAATQGPIVWKPVNNLMDIVENGFAAITYRNAVGLPTRTLGAADEFFKHLRYRAVVQAEAAVQAEAKGLTGRDFTDYVEQELGKAFDQATGQALNPRALLEAQITTFQQALFPGSLGSTLQQFRARHPLTHFVLPFLKTPINVLRYGQKMTPGLNLLQKEFRDAIKGTKGPEAQAQAVGQMALASVVMGLTATLAMNGKITGPGPSNPELRQQLVASGWQPFSYMFPLEDGTKKYVPLGRADPVGMAFSMSVSLVEAMRNNPEEDGGDVELGIGALSLALAKNFSDRTFLASLNQAFQALSEPEGKGEKWLANTAGNLIPFSSALKAYANPDPYLREANGFIETMLKTMPGYSPTLPPVRDPFGEPVARRIGLATTLDADTVDAEHSRIILETGEGIGKPSTTFEGLDLRDIIFKEGPNAGRNAYDRLGELSGALPTGPTLKEVLAKEIASSPYQDLPDGNSQVEGTRLNRLATITQKYREKAKKVLIGENKELQPLIKARQRDARGAILENRKKRGDGQPGARELLDALGATK